MRISVSKYYLRIILPIISLVIILSFIENDLSFLIYFLLFGILGMIGETLFSWLWDIFYPKIFWDYKVQTLFKNYTSYLNLIPWGLGGFVYWFCFIKLSDGLVTLSSKNIEFIYVSIIFFAIQLLTISVRLILKKKKFEFKKVNILNIWYLYLPFIVSLVYLTMLVDTRYLSIILITGIIVFLFEYSFGKVCHWVLGSRLWVYNYYSFDKGHITFLSIPAFMQGAVYFLFIGELIKAIL
jgi:hypothetical protein